MINKQQIVQTKLQQILSSDSISSDIYYRLCNITMKQNPIININLRGYNDYGGKINVKKQDLVVLAKILPEISTLQEYIICGEELNDDDISILMSPLSKLNKLQTLNLRIGEITCKGIETLAENAKKISSLNTIYLKCERTTDIEVPIWTKLIEGNKNINGLYLDIRTFDDSSQENFFDVMNLNQLINFAFICNIDINKEECALLGKKIGSADKLESLILEVGKFSNLNLILDGIQKNSSLKNFAIIDRSLSSEDTLALKNKLEEIKTTKKSSSFIASSPKDEKQSYIEIQKNLTTTDANMQKTESLKGKPPLPFINAKSLPTKIASTIVISSPDILPISIKMDC
jgi:hypothetical protein